MTGFSLAPILLARRHPFLDPFLYIHVCVRLRVRSTLWPCFYVFTNKCNRCLAESVSRKSDMVGWVGGWVGGSRVSVGGVVGPA